MKILVIGDPHGYQKYKTSVLKSADLILITGDIGKADLARKQAFTNIERKKQGLPEIEYTKKQIKAIYYEIYNSTINLLKKLANFAPVYLVKGNVGSTDKETKKDEKKFGIELPYLIKDINKIKNVNLIKNNVRNINGLRIGFLEYFADTCWIKEFKPNDYKKRLQEAKKDSDNARKVLKRFNDLDILLCHSPPYGVLDKVSGKFGAPKRWWGKHAGSKVILDYIKKKQPKYVFCGHMHETKGKKKIGKTEVYNVGFNGDYVLMELSENKIKRLEFYRGEW